MVLTGRSLEIALIITCGSAQLLFGYDQGVLSGLIGLDEFLSVFGYPDANLLGLIVSLYALGCFFGCGLAFIIGDRLGRKKTIAVGCIIIIIGTILQCTAYSPAHMIVARIFTGLGTGVNTVTVPVLQAELAHASRRGMLVIAESAIIIFGIAVANWVDYGFIFGSVTGQARWRTPVALQAVFPVLVLCMLPLMPESPRWLATQGRHDEVREVMARVQGRGAKPTDGDVQHAAEIIISTAEHEAKIAGGWREVFQMGESQNFRRILLGGGAQFMQQMAGINILTYYSPTIYRNSLGLDEKLSQILSGCGAISFWLGSSAPIWSIESFGRRSYMLLGGVLCCIWMIVLAATTAIVETQPAHAKAAGWGATASIIAFYFCFGLTWNGAPWLYGPEVNSLRMRNKGSAFSVCNNWLWNFVVVQVSPSGVANLGWKYWIIYAALNLAFIPTVYFFYPETSGHTLESMDQLFAEHQGWIVPPALRKRGTMHGVDADPLAEEEKGHASHREHVDVKDGSLVEKASR
ncbi:hypothetical protein PLICRDRAFT_170294 [Plicaturopsis crispa FD-325 SS-3]|nr:hypothetical protein PLICRDRAFT_170294 [Plicaturopsis crispa FD-325 SS-3]